MDIVKYLLENWGLLILAAVALVNAVNAVLKAVPGDQLGEESGKGVLPTILSVLDRLSVLSRSDAKGTLKMLGTTSKPDDKK